MEAWSVGSAPIVTLPHKVSQQYVWDGRVLTRTGQMLAGRCTMAFYHIMGINDCIADDYDDYIKIAVKLGKGVTRCGAHWSTERTHRH